MKMCSITQVNRGRASKQDEKIIVELLTTQCNSIQPEEFFVTEIPTSKVVTIA